MGFERGLRSGRVVEREDEDRCLRLDPERPEAAAQLLGVEAAGERVRKEVAGEAALGLVHDALAHQLEADDDRGLAGEQALELTELAALREHDQPTRRRRAPAAGNRHHQGPGPGSASGSNEVAPAPLDPSRPRSRR